MVTMVLGKASLYGITPCARFFYYYLLGPLLSSGLVDNTLGKRVVPYRKEDKTIGVKDDVIKFLRYTGDDYCEDPTVEISPECTGQEDEDGCCPSHRDCGVCRFEYMKRKGWLSPALTLPE